MSEQQAAPPKRMTAKKRYLVVSLGMLAGLSAAVATGTIFSMVPLCS